jgi:predicted DsbA family dithiol-disulfide isomerase
MNNPTRIRIDVWSDYVCPFCYLELPAIRKLEARFGDQLTVVWRAFELRPEPKPTLDPNGEYLHTTWERSVYPMASERGMTLKLPPVQPRSRKALEAVAFAEANGRFSQMHDALFKAFFEQGRDIGDPSVLCEIAGENGLDPQALRQALHMQTYTAAVLEDQQLARVLGISGVPIMFVRNPDASWEKALQLRGAVPYGAMESAVRQLLDGGNTMC